MLGYPSSAPGLKTTIASTPNIIHLAKLIDTAQAVLLDLRASDALCTQATNAGLKIHFSHYNPKDWQRVHILHFNNQEYRCDDSIGSDTIVIAQLDLCAEEKLIDQLYGQTPFISMKHKANSDGTRFHCLTIGKKIFTDGEEKL